MMKTFLTAVVALFLLGACASNPPNRLFDSGGARYYIAESPPSVSYYYAPYWSLYGYGITPWWGYAYYSPYFYPHDFHVWYAPWPYYAAWPSYSPWYAGTLHRHPAYWRHAPPYAHDRGGHGPGAPLPDYSGTPVVPPAEGGGRWRLADERGLPGEPRYTRPGAGLPASMGAARSFPARTPSQAPAPVGRAAMSPRITVPARSLGAPSGPAIGGRANPIPVPEPGPARHHQ